MATGITRLAVLLGAGFGGSYLYNNKDDVLPLVRDISRATIHEVTRPRGRAAGTATTNSSSSPSPATEAYGSALSELTSRVERLNRDIVSAASAGGQAAPILVVNGHGSSNGTKAVHPLMLTSVGLLVLVTIATARRKGVTMSQVLGVTQGMFSHAMQRVQEGMGALTGRLRSVRDDLGERIWGVEQTMHNAQKELREQLDAAVGDAVRSIDEVNAQVGKLQSVVDGLDSGFGNVDQSMQFAVRGIYMLCSYVATFHNVSQRAKGELGSFLNATPDEVLLETGPGSYSPRLEIATGSAPSSGAPE